MRSSSLYRTGPITGHTGRSRLLLFKAPTLCRGQVQLLNLFDQVGFLRNASGFSQFANMLTTLSAGTPYSECWLKSNSPHEQGRGRLQTYQKDRLRSRRNNHLLRFFHCRFNPPGEFPHSGFKQFRFPKKGHQFISNVQRSQYGYT
jgi:hypothetical protein